MTILFFIISITERMAFMANKINFQKELRPFSFSAQLLCTVQQLRDRILIRLFSDHGFLLQSEYLPGRRVSAPCKRTAASDLPDSAEVSGLVSRGRL